MSMHLYVDNNRLRQDFAGKVKTWPSIELGLATEPVVDLQTGGQSVIYHECLARLLLAEVFVLKGYEFIEPFEQQGCVGLLDEAVLDRALEALANNPSLYLGCNISPFTLAEPLIWQRIVARLAGRSDLAPRLTLEITESAPLSEIADVAERLRQVQAYGCRLALDDFGAGYATAAGLAQVDIKWDIIKIDRSFLLRSHMSDFRGDDLKSIIMRASCLAPLVVVEGIEGREQLERARMAGAIIGQGWLFEGKAPGELLDSSSQTSIGGWRPIADNLSNIFGLALQQGGVLDHLFAEADEVDDKTIQAGFENKLAITQWLRAGFEAVMNSAGRKGLIRHKQQERALGQTRWDM